MDGSLAQRRVKVNKVLVHPGEVNCVKVWPRLGKRLVATHSDCKQVYVWDIRSQKGAKDKHRAAANMPDLILEGHTDVAAYALDWSDVAPIVASGGRDRNILLWNVEEHFTKTMGINFHSADGIEDDLEEYQG